MWKRADAHKGRIKIARSTGCGRPPKLAAMTSPDPSPGAPPRGFAGSGYLGALAFLLNVAVTFLGMAAEILMAHATTEAQKGQAGGWSQAGNIGGAGLGGGAGLWMATHLAQPWIGSCVLGAAILLCALPLLVLPEPSYDHRHRSYVRSLWGVAKDAWTIARS